MSNRILLFLRKYSGSDNRWRADRAESYDERWRERDARKVSIILTFPHTQNIYIHIYIYMNNVSPWDYITMQQSRRKPYKKDNMRGWVILLKGKKVK